MFSNWRDFGIPVRVVRAHRLQSIHAPETGYRYDGLYSIEEPEVGQDEIQVKFVALPEAIQKVEHALTKSGREGGLACPFCQQTFSNLREHLNDADCSEVPESLGVVAESNRTDDGAPGEQFGADDDGDVTLVNAEPLVKSAPSPAQQTKRQAPPPRPAPVAKRRRGAKAASRSRVNPEQAYQDHRNKFIQDMLDQLETFADIPFIEFVFDWCWNNAVATTAAKRAKEASEQGESVLIEASKDLEGTKQRLNYKPPDES
eukprot:c19033_g1_i3.p2 GENE.c19033_g1_i3~~c19033_g1_i3.p2  ORF type:complete len:259 (+),score=73.20 c19033_g1_i3:1006-1782(+)